MNSAIYTGDIFHQRFQPMSHHFKYKIFMAYIDLDEIDILLPQSLFWGVNRSALISFHRQDYLSGSKLDLREAVQDLVFKRIGKKVEGPIRLLTHLRYFGHIPIAYILIKFRSIHKHTIKICNISNIPCKYSSS